MLNSEGKYGVHVSVLMTLKLGSVRVENIMAWNYEGKVLGEF